MGFNSAVKLCLARQLVSRNCADWQRVTAKAHVRGFLGSVSKRFMKRFCARLVPNIPRSGRMRQQTLFRTLTLVSSCIPCEKVSAKHEPASLTPPSVPPGPLLNQYRTSNGVYDTPELSE